MLNKEEYLLTLITEECGEVIQCVTKALRFGLQDVKPDQPLNNAERLVEELRDLAVILDLLRESSRPFREAMAEYEDKIKRGEKAQRVSQYMHLSRSLGCLEVRS
jgi:NTP pyrophosphatase (non-canonical NTP hydrolase)